jgi:hypothetical protein
MHAICRSRWHWRLFHNSSIPDPELHQVHSIFALGVCLDPMVIGAVPAFAMAQFFSASLQEYCDAARALHAFARACALTRVRFIAYPN